jgi:hypothetical protein
MQEARNALDQARREVSTRFDFKDTGTQINFDGSGIEIIADSEGRVTAALEVVKEKMVRRKISLKALQEGEVQPAARSNFKQAIAIVQGIDDEKARAIIKKIKGMGVKVQSQVQGDQLRVTSKSKDDLQTVMKALREDDYGIPLQFTNYR